MPAKRKGKEELSVMEAVDNLSYMADLDLSSHGKEGVPEPLLEEEHPLFWDDPQYVIENREVVKDTFRALHHYLQRLYESEKEQLKDIETQRGIQAIMLLAGEAAQKVDKYTALFKGVVGKDSVAQFKEYEELQKFYQNKIARKFYKAQSFKESWEGELASEEESLELQRRGLKDLETVRRDREYDLFYIKKEDGSAFFNPNLMRHIKLVGDFDQTFVDPEGEDPLLRTQMLTDRDAHLSAKEILRLAAPHIDEFYAEAMSHKGKSLVSQLNKALMALMLSANSGNLIQHTAGKNCSSYFRDFHFYLREALSSLEYQKILLRTLAERDQISSVSLTLLHALSALFFMRTGSAKEGSELVCRLIKKGGKGKGEAKTSHGSPLSFWNSLLAEDEQIRFLLKHYPNGPLLKTLDAFREREEKEGFDPLSQGNLPHQLYLLSNEELHISCLRLPAPLQHKVIHKAEVTEEFKGFLRFLGAPTRSQKHLLINFQDRTSWHEHARCAALEELSKEAEFTQSLIVVTFPKNTDFYHQLESYRYLNEADLFIEQFKQQLTEGEQCGFYFPFFLKPEQFAKFIDRSMEMIHVAFFGSKKLLSRKNRLDFIEIFYHYFLLKIIETTRPDSLSFTCKDAIDVGAAATASFFSFLRVFSGRKHWTSQEKDILLWMLYAPALMVRDRAIDRQVLHRFISAIAVVEGEGEAHRKELVKLADLLYEKTFLSQIKEGLSN